MSLNLALLRQAERELSQSIALAAPGGA